MLHFFIALSYFKITFLFKWLHTTIPFFCNILMAQWWRDTTWRIQRARARWCSASSKIKYGLHQPRRVSFHVMSLERPSTIPDRYLMEILQRPALRFVMRKPRFDANRNSLSTCTRWCTRNNDRPDMPLFDGDTEVCRYVDEEREREREKNIRAIKYPSIALTRLALCSA